MNTGNISNDKKSKQIKSEVDFQKIKNNVILKKIFENMKTYTKLKIIKCNQQIQKRLNLSIDDYKDYCQKYSSIEIELKLVDNKYNNKYNKFINMPDEEKEYFNIYFDNSKEEIKRNYLIENEKVNIIKIRINHQVKSFRSLFYNCYSISSINFKKFNRTDITDMSFMFSFCTSLKELNLSNFNTDNVTNMSYMFRGCYYLTELNLSNFNTNNVTDMSFMFSECKNLKKLNISNFNTNNVTHMISIFYQCKSIKELNISSNFNSNKKTKMNRMFFGY